MLFKKNPRCAFHGAAPRQRKSTGAETQSRTRAICQVISVFFQGPRGILFGFSLYRGGVGRNRTSRRSCGVSNKNSETCRGMLVASFLSEHARIPDCHVECQTRTRTRLVEGQLLRLLWGSKSSRLSCEVSNKNSETCRLVRLRAVLHGKSPGGRKTRAPAYCRHSERFRNGVPTDAACASGERSLQLRPKHRRLKLRQLQKVEKHKQCQTQEWQTDRARKVD